MSDTDDAARPPADLNYATEKILRTVDELALSDVPLPQRLRLAWLDQGERAYPPGDDIPPGLAAAIREINERLTDIEGRAQAPQPSEAPEIATRLVYLACGLNAALAVGGHIYYGEGEV